jgi:predicted nuclease of predicted toxin-antitoxin system
MDLVADESLDQAVVQRLRADGHHVAYVAEMDPGITDEAVLALANEQSALLVTADKDFGELVYRQRRLSSCVVLVRLAGLSQARKADLISGAMAEHGPELSRAFTVVTSGMVRIRREP